MDQRYIPNDFLSLLNLTGSPEILLVAALQRILNSSPPQSTYSETQLKGLFTGHTGIAYLFLHVSASLPKLQIHGYSATHWAHAYISGDRGRLKLEIGNCGVASEPLCHAAVRACITKDLNDVRDFLALLPHVIAPPTPAAGEGEADAQASAATRSRSEGKSVAGGAKNDPFPSDLIYGRAGSLYLLRIVRHWVPQSAPLVERFVVAVTDRILATDDDGAGNRLWHDKRYLGAAHGDIGILTQLVLTTPPLARRLGCLLEDLLAWQLEDGNWPSSVPAGPAPASQEIKAGRKKDLVQWCHGAPGFVLSLLSLRPFFPGLRNEIDAAVEKGRRLTWECGLLRKEPSLCHGILGNALIFPPGPQREHFLALATPEKIAAARRADPDVFRPAAYGKDCALLMNYDPCAAWAWLVCSRQTPRMILYNDV